MHGDVVQHALHDPGSGWNARRAPVRAGRSIRYLVMQRVLDYIAVHGLYAPEAAGEVRR